MQLIYRYDIGPSLAGHQKFLQKSLFSAFTVLKCYTTANRGDVCGPRLRSSSTCRARIVGLLVTERSLLPFDALEQSATRHY